ncbi:tRNA 2'-phosphotransferase 1 [Pleurotus eryngii]|uniref:2'-phosphotransferase n=1 Tax=Pleurotus eryngii TaxID=5323 RepID=A0A9P6A8B9_PLEER|nr:tRNA 2'-phosphotransferase 1 [Pleurotus eryngii]
MLPSRRYLNTLPNVTPRKRDDSVSRTISWLLRHSARNEGLDTRQDGFIRVEELLRHPRLGRIDFNQLRTLVENDKKGRFRLMQTLERDATATWWIRANQGHSFMVDSLDLQPITSADQVKMAVHGTSFEAWDSIAVQGLSRMSRNHIHLANHLPNSQPVTAISGLRPRSDILVYINLHLALSSGIKFFLSANGVVLTPGNEAGFLHPPLFEKVERAYIRNGKLTTRLIMPRSDELN